MRQEAFPTETSGLAEATRPRVIELQDGEEFDLRIEPVAKQIGDEVALHTSRSSSRPTAVRRG